MHLESIQKENAFFQQQHINQKKKKAAKFVKSKPLNYETAYDKNLAWDQKRKSKIEQLRLFKE